MTYLTVLKGKEDTTLCDEQACISRNARGAVWVVLTCLFVLFRCKGPKIFFATGPKKGSKILKNLTSSPIYDVIKVILEDFLATLNQHSKFVKMIENYYYGQKRSLCC